MSEKIRDIRDFLALLNDVKGPNASGNYTARCPAHDDKTASLTVCAKASQKDGKRRVYLHCQTGHCQNDEIISKLGLTARDLILDNDAEVLPSGQKVYTVRKPQLSPKANDGGLGKLTNIYDYTDADGKLLFQVCRFEKSNADGKREKTFRQRRYLPADPAAKNGYVWSVPEEIRNSTIYHLPAVLDAINGGLTVYVVEGEKDADTMTRLGYTATTNAGGAGKWADGHTALLKGADVVVLYDYDVEKNNFAGQKHAWELAKAVNEIANRVRMPDIKEACPDIPAKGDITDLFQILGDEQGKEAFDALVDTCGMYNPDGLPPWMTPQEAAAELYSRVGGYCVHKGCICQSTDEGPRKLGTFVALPTQIVTRDDGVNLDKVFVIDGWARQGRMLPQVQVQAAKFKAMDWVLENWDFAANLMPGNMIKDKLRYVITEVGEMNAKRKTVYTHTGWRKIDGKWIYLYQGGAVGADNVSVDLESVLSSYTLRCGDDIALLEAARKSFTARFCMAEHIAVPLLGVIFLAPLREFLKQAGCTPGFALFLIGKSGFHKSTAIALMLSYFGDFHSKNLPASFNDTSNTIRKKAFVLKDLPIVVDDYHPESSMQERRRMESTAQALSRAFGDGADRGRMRADLSLQEAMPPRCVAIMSGEDMPNIGESGTARYYVVSVGRSDIPITDELTEAQAMAKSGILRKVMRGYIEYLQPHADSLGKKLEKRFVTFRTRAAKETQGAHGRAPEAVAHIMLGYSMMQDYLVSIGAISDEEANADFMDAWRVLVQNSQDQAREAQDEKPCKMFLATMCELLVNRTAAVKDLTDANAPIPSKGMVGYVDAEYYYFLPETAYTMVSKLYSDQGVSFILSKRMLFKQMRDDGIVVSDVDGKTARGKKINGKLTRLLWIPRRFFDDMPPPAEEQMKIDGYVQVEDEDMPFK
ncbi:MAG: hypothetical protein RR301_08040 [Clostridia bacterium]